MTALAYKISDDHLWVAMDTKVSQYPSMKALKFTTKQIYLPHARTLICGTGQLNALLEWFHHLMGIRSTATTIEEIMEESQILPDLLGDYDFSLKSTTLYHFGYSIEKETYTGFACRSRNGFQAEILAKDSLCFKPGGMEIYEELKVFRESHTSQEELGWLMRRIRAYDESQPLDEQVGVGGEIVIAIMENPNSCSIITTDNFEDYQEMSQSFRASV